MNASEAFNHDERISTFKGISTDRARAGRSCNDCLSRKSQCHDNELAYGDGLYSTVRLHCQPPGLQFSALRATGECVIAIPTVDIIGKVVDIGNCSGQDVDKFTVFGLTPLPAENVKAPLIAECLANIECRVVDDSLVDKYELFILDGVKAWIDPDRKERRTFHAIGDGTFVVDGETLNLREKMIKWQSII